jgi:hypothetical protein
MVKQESGATQSKKELLWRERLARFTASGRKVAEFCNSEAVSEASFYRWRKQLSGSAGAPMSTARFIDAGGLAPAAIAAPAAGMHHMLEMPAEPGLEVRLDLGHGLMLHILRR